MEKKPEIPRELLRFTRSIRLIEGEGLSNLFSTLNGRTYGRAIATIGEMTLRMVYDYMNKKLPDSYENDLHTSLPDQGRDALRCLDYVAAIDVFVGRSKRDILYPMIDRIWNLTSGMIDYLLSGKEVSEDDINLVYIKKKYCNPIRLKDCLVYLDEAMARSAVRDDYDENGAIKADRYGDRFAHMFLLDIAQEYRERNIVINSIAVINFMANSILFQDISTFDLSTFCDLDVKR